MVKEVGAAEPERDGSEVSGFHVGIWLVKVDAHWLSLSRAGKHIIRS